MSAKAAVNTETTKAATAGAANPSNVELLLKKDTAALVKTAREHYTVENGQGKFPDNFYELMLPEGISMETVNALQKHDSQLIAATALIHGEQALAAAVKDPELQTSSVTFKAGNHKFSHVFSREGESRNPKTGVVSKTFATVKSSVVFSGAKGDSGDLGKVRSHLRTLGAAVLV